MRTRSCRAVFFSGCAWLLGASLLFGSESAGRPGSSPAFEVLVLPPACTAASPLPLCRDPAPFYRALLLGLAQKGKTARSADTLHPCFAGDCLEAYAEKAAAGKEAQYLLATRLRPLGSVTSPRPPGSSGPAPGPGSDSVPDKGLDSVMDQEGLDSVLDKRPDSVEVAFLLFGTASQKPVLFQESRLLLDSASLVSALKEAVLRLEFPAGPADIASAPALSPALRLALERPPVLPAHPRLHRLSGYALLGAALAAAYAAGPLTFRDDNDKSPEEPLLPHAGGKSAQRGFFAAALPSPRYLAQGGAGLAGVGDASALSLNPAGLSRLGARHLAVNRSHQLGGVPSLSLGFGGPLLEAPYAEAAGQGVGVAYEGDALASEWTFAAGAAFAPGPFLPFAFREKWGLLAGPSSGPAASLPVGLGGLRLGALGKIHLVEVGAGGAGIERSTGHGFGLGLDLGAQWPVTASIDAGMVLRDVLSVMRYRNTFTGASYGESLPPELLVGAGYRVSPSLRFAVDGQKGLYADQSDQVRLGAEAVLWKYLRLRGGLRQVFSRESVRLLTFGFGVEGEALGRTLSIQYGQVLGLDEAAPLGGRSYFGMDAGF